MTATLLLYSPLHSAVHAMHMSAIADGARRKGLRPTTAIAGRGLPRALRRRTEVVFLQATGLWNLVAVPALRARSDRIVYYLHEPMALRVKIRESNLVRALVWHVVQQMDVLLADVVLVSREELRPAVERIYRRRARTTVAVAPLLMPEVVDVGEASRHRITYLGRIDERRFFTAFTALTETMRTAGLRPTILTGSGRGISASTAADLRRRGVDVIIEPDFDEALKARILRETAVVWNPKRTPISQSGVTVDALRFGCRLVLTPADPYFGRLVEQGVAVEWTGDLDDETWARLARWERHVGRTATEVFARSHGGAAFDRCYAPVLTSSARRRLT